MNLAGVPTAWQQEGCCTVFQQYSQMLHCLLSLLCCCCFRHFTKAQAQYGAYFHKVLFSGTLQRQRHTKVTLRRVTFNALDKLLLHQQASGGTSSALLPSQHTTAAVDQQIYFLCVYAASHIVWHGVAAVEVRMPLFAAIHPGGCDCA